MMGTSPRIAVIEDEITIGSLIVFNLKNRVPGNPVVDHFLKVDDKEIKELVKGNYDLFVIDLMLPLGYSGEQIIMQLKENPLTRTVPKIVVTAKTLETHMAFCFKIGADDFIKKPFSTVEMAAIINVHLARHKECNERKAMQDSSEKSKRSTKRA